MTTQAQPESPTIEAFDGSSLSGLLDVDELLAVGFLRSRLHADAHQVVSDRVRQALAALEQAGRVIDGCYRDGDDGGLPAGCHYFPTNDLAGTRHSDGHHEGLWFAKTWDYRAGSNPGWPQAAGVALCCPMSSRSSPPWRRSWDDNWRPTVLVEPTSGRC